MGVSSLCDSSVWQRGSGREWSQGLSVLLEMGPELLVLIFRAFSKLGLGSAPLPAVPKVTTTGRNFIVRVLPPLEASTPAARTKHPQTPMWWTVKWC